MKETPIFEEVFNRLIKLPGFWVNLLVGGLLSFVPIVNIFAFGYLYQVSRRVRQAGQPVLPAWQDWQGLFTDGLRFAAVWLCYWLLPLVLAAGFTSILTLISLGALSDIFHLSVMLLANILFVSALYRYNMRKDFKDLLDVSLILRMTWMELPRLILPSFLFLGIFVWLLPLYGFGLFGGFLLLITYTSLRYRNIEQEKPLTI